jgi:hypothetical protein
MYVCIGREEIEERYGIVEGRYCSAKEAVEKDENEMYEGRRLCCCF